MDGVENRDRRFNRKRKKKFLRKEKDEAKRGRFGRGSDIDGDTFNYFLRVLEVKLEDFTNPEDEEIFIDNVFEQTAANEILISCNQLGSMAIEKFLPLANDKILLRFTYAFSKDLRKVCCDEFGSHVLQQLIAVVTAQMQKTVCAEVLSPEMVTRFKNWLHQVSKYVINNLEEFLWHKSANHIIRTVLESLSGLQIGSTTKVTKREMKLKLSTPVGGILVSPIPEGRTLVKECGKFILQIQEPDLLDIVYGNHTSALLQTILCSLHKVHVKLSHKLLKHLLNVCFDPSLENCSEKKDETNKPMSEYVSEIFTYEATTCLMDVMISTASDKMFTQIYARCFINRLKPLSMAPNANFCVQNLIKRCTEKIEFEAIFDELSSNFEALVNYGKHGVLLAVAQACHRLGAKQGQFIKEIQRALHCAEPKKRCGHFPLLLTYMVNYETWCQSEDSKEQNAILPISLQGSLILQTILNFPETVKIVHYLLHLDNKYLKLLFCDPRGSHIADAYFASKTVGEKSREKMFRKLQGTYVALALSKHGSRVLDVIWVWSSLKNRKLILEELSPSETVINSMQWGNIFSEKSGLSLFKRRPKDWEDVQSHDVRKRKLFSDLLDSS